MANLQIRDLPGPLHQMLQLRARQHYRSLNQQALSDLQMAFGGDPRERRRQAIADMQALTSQQGVQKFDPSPEDLIRLDRSRSDGYGWIFKTGVGCICCGANY